MVSKNNYEKEVQNYVKNLSIETQIDLFKKCLTILMSPETSINTNDSHTAELVFIEKQIDEFNEQYNLEVLK